ncbi:IS66 family transposase [Lacticaseibacillus paracasei]|uniref:IS66 family transposase n=1 Tax=Lacticaseibacillus paracasei TaxID=1597 RepID=UPI0021A84690
MENVLLDGRLELSNNRVECAVKELVIGRKNWLFFTSFKRTRSSRIILPRLHN